MSIWRLLVENDNHYTACGSAYDVKFEKGLV
jgi:hypothetical protein